MKAKGPGGRSHIDLIAAGMERARAERGIPVAELARRVGINRKRLWRVLNGERIMRADEFVRLCGAMGLGLEVFVSPRRPSLSPIASCRSMARITPGTRMLARVACSNGCIASKMQGSRQPDERRSLC